MEPLIGWFRRTGDIAAFVVTWKILAIPTLSRIQTLTGYKTVCGFQCFKKSVIFMSLSVSTVSQKIIHTVKRPPPQEMEWKMFEKMTTLTFSINFCTFSLVTRAFKPLFCLAPWWKNINKNPGGWCLSNEKKACVRISVARHVGFRCLWETSSNQNCRGPVI